MNTHRCRLLQLDGSSAVVALVLAGVPHDNCIESAGWLVEAAHTQNLSFLYILRLDYVLATAMPALLCNW
jgi:hypothetical protein